MELCSKISQPSKNIKKKSKKQLLFKIKLRLGDDIIPCFFFLKNLASWLQSFLFAILYGNKHILFLVLQVLHVFIFNSSIETP